MNGKENNLFQCKTHDFLQGKEVAQPSSSDLDLNVDSATYQQSDFDFTFLCLGFFIHKVGFYDY